MYEAHIRLMQTFSTGASQCEDYLRSHWRLF